MLDIVVFVNGQCIYIFINVGNSSKHQLQTIFEKNKDKNVVKFVNLPILREKISFSVIKIHTS